MPGASIRAGHTQRPGTPAERPPSGPPDTGWPRPPDYPPLGKERGGDGREEKGEERRGEKEGMGIVKSQREKSKQGLG